MAALLRLIKGVVLALATGFGTGFSPFASGTVGSLLAIPLVWGVWQILAGWPWQLFFACILAITAIPICGVAEKHFQTKDDGRIVADEYLIFPLCMVGLPAEPIMLVVAFITARVFDIWKPQPANRLQSVKGGTGIVLDDVIAAMYSLAANHLVYYFLLK